MKKLFAISILVLIIIAISIGCTSSSSGSKSSFEISPQLKRLDSLMQSRPDSALMILLSLDKACLLSTGCDDLVSRTANACVGALLLSEALYKTYNPQDGLVETHGRASLQTAMRYFDSLAVQYPNNDDITMFSARAHYMNGVGFYENDSVVEACEEYLKVLEIMENHFDVEKLTGHKAKFMGLTYTRLGALFSDLFIIKPAIYLGQQALFYCKIAPTSKYSISKNLYKLGQLYDLLNETDTASYYYNEALKSLPDSNSLIYRDIASSAALLSYELGYGLQPSLKQLFNVANQAKSDDEFLTRHFTIGSLYFEEGIYDSAALYLNQVFEYEENKIRKQQSADYLFRICQISHDTINSDKYSNFLAQNALSNYENSFKTSILDELFKNYLNKKSQNFQIKKVIPTGIVFSVVALVVLAASVALFLVKKYNKLNKEHHRNIETLKKAKYREKTKMLDTIKEQEAIVYALEHELGQKRQEADTLMDALLKEPVCQKIINSVATVNISSRDSYADYPHLKLDESSIIDLYAAVDKHFPSFKQRLLLQFPQLKQKDILLCYLGLIGMEYQQISVLIQYHYTTIFRKVGIWEKSLDNDATFLEFLQKTAVL